MRGAVRWGPRGQLLLPSREEGGRERGSRVEAVVPVDHLAHVCLSREAAPVDGVVIRIARWIELLAKVESSQSARAEEHPDAAVH